MSTRDEVSLSSEERQSLAHLEARAKTDDPALAARLRGRTGRAILARWRKRRPVHMAAWVGPALVLLGLVLAVVAVSSAVWLSVVALALCVGGGCGIGMSVRERISAKKDRSTP